MADRTCGDFLPTTASTQDERHPAAHGNNPLKTIFDIYLHGVYSRVPGPRARKAAPRAPPPQAGQPYGKSTSTAQEQVNVQGKEKRQEAPIASGREKRPPAAAPPLSEPPGPCQGRAP
jgi:hypothetical protein